MVVYLFFEVTRCSMLLRCINLSFRVESLTFSITFLRGHVLGGAQSLAKQPVAPHGIDSLPFSLHELTSTFKIANVQKRS
jgi:hypothetical protein